MTDIRKLRVLDLMQKTVYTIEHNATLSQAACKMSRKGCSSLVISPKDDSDAYGIVTRKDLLNVLVMETHDDFITQVGDLMTKPAITISPAMSIDNCLMLMRVTGTRRLPVVDNHQLVGMISNSDVFNRMISHMVCGERDSQEKEEK